MVIMQHVKERETICVQNNCEIKYSEHLKIIDLFFSGTRVMSMIANRGMSNMVEGDKPLMWAIPDEWTFEEAATVPVAYGTVFYALVNIYLFVMGS